MFTTDTKQLQRINREKRCSERFPRVLITATCMLMSLIMVIAIIPTRHFICLRPMITTTTVIWFHTFSPTGASTDPDKQSISREFFLKQIKTTTTASFLAQRQPLLFTMPIIRWLVRWNLLQMISELLPDHLPHLTMELQETCALPTDTARPILVWRNTNDRNSMFSSTR
ncbi:hypothetical protein SDC9_55861 [bioreactor metagenome]|uniref:Uncharacterized protein n=1 Tax=bioreactor metagenome TaxID=1076179 RepID=A0A644X0X2_9ZZZZ